MPKAVFLQACYWAHKGQRQQVQRPEQVQLPGRVQLPVGQVQLPMEQVQPVPKAVQELRVEFDQQKRARHQGRARPAFCPMPRPRPKPRCFAGLRPPGTKPALAVGEGQLALDMKPALAER